MKRLNHERRILLYSLICGGPGTIATVVLLWVNPHDFNVRITLALFVLACWLGFAIAIAERVVRPLQTASNLLSALREGDYSVRGHHAQHEDALGELYFEINQLGALLRSQRLSALEATAFVEAVMRAIDVAVFAFDDRQNLKLANPAGLRLLAAKVEHVLGRSAHDLGLGECLEGESVRLLTTTRFPGGTGRFGVRRSLFREQGLPHSLVVIADLSQALRAEETKAWQKLVRVLGHELNNSLAPIKSIAGSLASLLRNPKRAADWEEDMGGGLDIIASRAESLSRFMQAYSHLARLPAPSKKTTHLGDLLHRICFLEQRLTVDLLPGPEVSLALDTGQIEQALINLLRNAVDAALEGLAAGHSKATVSLTWIRESTFVDIQIRDNGLGLANTTNLFVPFFTTKPEGSGIGLVLSRQIVENHEGSLTLVNRIDGPSGCLASLRLPI